MNKRGTFFIVAGLIFLVNAGVGASKAPNITYMAGTFLPGMIFLIWGLKKRMKAKLEDAAASDGSSID